VSLRKFKLPRDTESTKAIAYNSYRENLPGAVEIDLIAYKNSVAFSSFTGENGFDTSNISIISCNRTLSLQILIHFMLTWRGLSNVAVGVHSG